MTFPKDKHAYISGLFAAIAKRYDLSNTVLSFGLDKHWRKVLIKRAELAPGDKVLDVGTGTGKLAAKIAGIVGRSNVVGVDFCQEMLDIAGHKYKKIRFMKALAEALPFHDNEFDCAVTGFTLRNMPDMEVLFREMRRVTRVGGKVAALEFNRPNSKFLNRLYLFYLKTIIPYIGGMISGKKDAYIYLMQSIEDFKGPGLTDIVTYPLMFGTVTIYVGVV